MSAALPNETYKNNKRTVTSNTTILDNDSLLNCNTTSGAINITLKEIPANFSTVYILYVKDIGGLAATNNITIIAPAGFKINNAQTYVINQNNQSVSIIITSNTDYLLTDSTITPTATPIYVYNTVYVMKNGLDSSGLVERFDKPFLTIAAARTAALAYFTSRSISSRVRIVVESGNYTETITLYDFIDYDLGNSVITSPIGSNGIVTANVAFTNLTYGYNCIIYGNALIQGANITNTPPVEIVGTNTIGIRILLNCSTIFSSAIDTVKTRTGYLKIVCDAIYNSNVNEFVASSLSPSCITISTNVSYQAGGSPMIEIHGAKIYMNQAGSYRGCIKVQSGLVGSYNTNRCKIMLVNCEIGSWSTVEPAISCNYNPSGTTFSIGDITLKNTTIFSISQPSISNFDIVSTGNNLRVFSYNSAANKALFSDTNAGGYTTENISNVLIDPNVNFNQGEII